MRKSFTLTIGLLFLTALANAQIVIKPEAKFKLASYDTYIQFAYELTASKIIVKNDSIELINATMANSPTVNTSFSVSVGNLTIFQLFTNSRFTSYLYLPSGNTSTVKIFIPDGIWTNDRFSVVSNASQYTYTYNSTSRILTISLVVGSTIKLEITKVVNGEPCSLDEECLGGYCVHGICRSTPTYCGDGYCDYELGEYWTNCWKDCGFMYSPCKFDFELDYPKEIQTSLNQTKEVEITLTNVGTCKLLSSQLIIQGIPEDWFELEPNMSSPLGKGEKFDFTLILQPTREGTYTLSLSLFNKYQRASIIKLNKTYYLTVKVLPALKCPICPPCTAWSECVDNKQTRICHTCSEQTNYICQPYEESRECREKIQPTPISRLRWYERFARFLYKLFEEMNLLLLKLLKLTLLL
jgi:hypothetical protein